MKAYADLLYHENIFNPVSVMRNTGNQQIYGCATGNLYGNGQEIALLNVLDPLPSKIQTFSYDATQNQLNLTSTLNVFTSSCRYLAAGNLKSNSLTDELVTAEIVGNEIKLFENGIEEEYHLIGLLGFTIGGIAIGEFDAANNCDELVVVSPDGEIKIFAFDYSANNFLEMTLTNNVTSHPQIKGITVGDFNNNGADEIALLSGNPGLPLLKTFRVDNNQLVNTAVSNDINTINFSYEPWSSITSGDFEGDGFDEIMIYNAKNGGFRIYRQNVAEVDFKAEEIFPVNQQNGQICTIRLPDNNNRDAIVTLRNYDGQISVFNMDGLCPGMNLQNQTIDEMSSLDHPAISNNYVIDYHSNNTLIAGNNFTIEAPAKVEMASGKEVIWNPGFSASEGSDVHAWIEPALECNPSTFRKVNAVNETNIPEIISQRNKNKTNTKLNAYPNPGSGKYTVALYKNNSPEKINTIRVSDMMGKVIYELKGINEYYFSFDITNSAKGIYFVHASSDDGAVITQKIILQ